MSAFANNSEVSAVSPNVHSGRLAALPTGRRTIVIYFGAAKTLLKVAVTHPEVLREIGTRLTPLMLKRTLFFNMTGISC